MSTAPVPEWPTEFDVNMFIVGELDSAVPPEEIRVVTWSNLFGEGGSVSLDANMPGGKCVALARIEKKTSGSVVAERAHLQALLDDWRTDDPAADWAALVNAARDDLRSYYERQAAKAAEKLEALR